MTRAGFLAAAMAALVASGCGSSASSSSATKPAGSGTTSSPVPAPNVPARDRFTGTLSGGTGSLAGADDVLEARLQAPAAGANGTRRLTLWILSTGCRAGTPCAHLGGSLRGQLTPVRALPDIGRRYRLTAAGSLHPIGAVTATGTAAGTGNIMSGFESLQLALSGRHGSARLTARSARVPSFTSP
jgi:hypothetical protein